ncbi:MAG: LapA family protein [Chlorobi bacterium]|nr:LapA family protein [Chlorobiota bacterium]
MKTSFWFFIIVAVLLVTFSVQNSSATEISFLMWTVQISKAVLIIATFLIGLVTGALYGYFSRKPAKAGKEQEKESVETTAQEDEEVSVKSE